MPVPTHDPPHRIPALPALGTHPADGDKHPGQRVNVSDVASLTLDVSILPSIMTSAPLPDVLPGPGDPPLRVLFCGINPGLVSAATGHHFARPGNRFWPALHASGFTPRVLAPAEQGELRALGLGLTNVAPRPTAKASELADAELVAGGERLRALVSELAPAWLAVIGIGAYRVAFADRRAAAGRQERSLGDTGVWVLPNPSGLNAHQTPQTLAAAFEELRKAL